MKKEDETKAIKVKPYKNRMKTADKSPYLMRVVSNGTCRQDDILAEVARETGWTMSTVRMYYGAFLETLMEELLKGHKIQTPIGLFEPAVSGSVPFAQSPIDPKKNKVYVRVTLPAELRKTLAKLKPVVVGGPRAR